MRNMAGGFFGSTAKGNSRLGVFVSTAPSGRDTHAIKDEDRAEQVE